MQPYVTIVCAAFIAAFSGCNQQASNQDGEPADSLLLDTIDVPRLVDTLSVTTASLAGIAYNHDVAEDSMNLYGIEVSAAVDQSRSVALDLDLAGKDERSVARLIIALQQRINLLANGIIYSDESSLLGTLPKEDAAPTDTTRSAIMMQLVDDHLLITIYSDCDQSELDFLMECINDPSLWVNDDETEENLEDSDEVSDDED